MCSKEKATFGPIFDQVLQALINTLGPQCGLFFTSLYLLACYYEPGNNCAHLQDPGLCQRGIPFAEVRWLPWKI